MGPKTGSHGSQIGAFRSYYNQLVSSSEKPLKISNLQLRLYTQITDVDIKPDRSGEGEAALFSLRIKKGKRISLEAIKQLFLHSINSIIARLQSEQRLYRPRPECWLALTG